MRRYNASRLYAIAFLIGIICTVLNFSCAEDMYIEYKNRFGLWRFSIADYVDQSPYEASADFRENIRQHDETTEINGIDIGITETLFDEFTGIINVRFHSDSYVLRPFECLNQYAPVYQLPYEDEPFICYVDFDLYVGGQLVLFDTFCEGLSEDQQTINIIKVALPDYDCHYEPEETEAEIICRIKLMGIDRCLFETAGTFSFSLLPDCTLEKATISHARQYSNTLLPSLIIYRTPTWLLLDNRGATILDETKTFDLYYIWSILDERGYQLLDSFTGGTYRETLPEHLELRIVEIERQTGSKVRVCETINLQKTNDYYIEHTTKQNDNY